MTRLTEQHFQMLPLSPPTHDALDGAGFPNVTPSSLTHDMFDWPHLSNVKHPLAHEMFGWSRFSNVKHPLTHDMLDWPGF